MQKFLSYVDNYIEADRAVGCFLVDRMVNNSKHVWACIFHKQVCLNGVDTSYEFVTDVNQTPSLTYQSTAVTDNTCILICSNRITTYRRTIQEIWYIDMKMLFCFGDKIIFKTKAQECFWLILKTNKPSNTWAPAWHHDEAYQRLWDVKHSLSRLIVSLFH